MNCLLGLMKRSYVLLYVLCVLVLIPCLGVAQKATTYTCDFIRACSDSSKDGRNVLAVFKVTPLVQDFKLVLSMRVVYQFQHGNEITRVLSQNEDNIDIIIYGKDIEQKNKFVYNFIKDNVQIEKEPDDVYFIAFIFYGITNDKIETMGMQYGLWERLNTDVRYERKYEFLVDKVENGFINQIMKAEQKK